MKLCGKRIVKHDVGAYNPPKVSPTTPVFLVGFLLHEQPEARSWTVDVSTVMLRFFLYRGRLGSSEPLAACRMPSPLVRPSVADLVFQVYGRPLHPELFEILAERQVRQADFVLTVRITRTGHVISWENDDVYLTEVTAAADQELPSQRRLLDYKLRHEQNTSLPCAHGIHYQASFQVETLPPELFIQVHEEILADGSKRGLLHHFSSSNRLTLAPLGFLQAEFRPGCLFLSSFHTFPSEHTVIKTQSLIEKRG